MHDVDIRVTQEWAHIRFDPPVPLVRRDECRPGDIVQSSHGYKLHLTRVRVNTNPGGSTYFWGELHNPGSGFVRSELYDGHLTMPLLHRGPGRFTGQPYGGPVGDRGVDYHLTDGCPDECARWH